MRKIFNITITAMLTIILLVLWIIIGKFIFNGLEESIINICIVSFISAIVGSMISIWFILPFYEWIEKKKFF